MERQVFGANCGYVARRSMAEIGPDQMLHWLGLAAREARERAGRRQVHIAAAADVGETTISRFEAGKQWPRSPDRTIAAYAQVLEVDAIEIWQEALRRWDQER